MVTQKKKKPCAARKGSGAEQNDPIWVTEAFTHPVIPYRPSSCYICMVLTDSLMYGNVQHFTGPATSCSFLPCPQAQVARFAEECRVSVCITVCFLPSLVKCRFRRCHTHAAVKPFITIAFSTNDVTLQMDLQRRVREGEDNLVLEASED